MTGAGLGRPRVALSRDLGDLPADRVLQVQGVTPDDIARALAHGGAELPVALALRAPPDRTLRDFVAAVLDDLQATAIGLFPGWLPEAEHIRTSSGAGLVAVRAVAAAYASQSADFAPFLGDLAAMALGGRAATRRRFPPEIRVVGLTRVITRALGRSRLVLVVDVPANLGAEGEQIVEAGCGWLADRGRLGVWLTGSPLVTVDWLVSARLPIASAGSVDIPVSQSLVVGAPHPRSAAEAALEEALANRSWAVGRHWNQTYQSHVLRNPVRLDLIWPDERCIVEIDGPEHCEPVKFDSDRRRDVQLQLDGYAVLRFTNARIMHDVDAVVTQIGQFIDQQRESGRETA
jgi:very-short-patch-repair endonuclease